MRSTNEAFNNSSLGSTTIHGGIAILELYLRGSEECMVRELQVEHLVTLDGSTLNLQTSTLLHSKSLFPHPPIDVPVVGEYLIAVSVDSSGMPIILSLEGRPNYRYQRQQKGGSFAKNKANYLNRYRIHYLAQGVCQTIILKPTYENYHFVQCLGTDKWLLVRSRAHGYSDRNAHIYSSTGEHLSSFHAGDAIQDVQVSENEYIWMSFFDECHRDNHIGAGSGLVCLDENGKLIFRNDYDYGLHIFDCYALNVASADNIWVYYYTDFLLAQISDFQIQKQWPPIPIKGSYAFAINLGYHALLDGGYGDTALFAGNYDKRDSLFIVNLDSMEFEELIPITQSGQVLKSFRAFGRASRLFLYTKNRWSVVRLDMEYH